MVLPQGNIISFENLGEDSRSQRQNGSTMSPFPSANVCLGYFSIGQLLFMVNVFPCRNHLEIHLRVSFHLAISSKRVVY